MNEQEVLEKWQVFRGTAKAESGFGLAEGFRELYDALASALERAGELENDAKRISRVRDHRERHRQMDELLASRSER